MCIGNEFCVSGLNFVYRHEVFYFNNPFDVLNNFYEKPLQVLHLVFNFFHAYFNFSDVKYIFLDAIQVF